MSVEEKADELDERKVERYLPAFVLGLAFLVCLGAGLAKMTGDSHWIEKCGKVVIACSLMLTYLQFKYEAVFGRRLTKRLNTVRELAADKGMTRSEAESAVNLRVAQFRVRFEEVRRRVLLHSLGGAAFGELTAAFGSDIYFVVMSVAARVAA